MKRCRADEEQMVHPHLHSRLITVCLSLLWDVLRVRLEGKDLHVLIPAHKHTHRGTHPSRDVTVDISVNTSNCFPAPELES